MHRNNLQRHHEELQKITINIPKELLEIAQDIDNTNITETIKTALRMFIAAKAAQKIRTMRGKVEFSIDLETLREDR